MPYAASAKRAAIPGVGILGGMSLLTAGTVES